jgi:hypothetical protein
MSNPSRPLKWHTIKDAEAASGCDLIVFRRCCGYHRSVSLTEIEEAVKELSREELAKLAAFIARQDKLVWDEDVRYSGQGTLEKSQVFLKCAAPGA